jgi:hypothetical protein
MNSIYNTPRSIDLNQAFIPLTIDDRPIFDIYRFSVYNYHPAKNKGFKNVKYYFIIGSETEAALFGICWLRRNTEIHQYHRMLSTVDHELMTYITPLLIDKLRQLKHEELAAQKKMLKVV